MIAYLIFLDSTILYGIPQQQYPIKRCISLIIIIFTIIHSEIRHVPEATNVITILYTERYNSAGCHNIVSNWILSCSSYSWLIQIVYWVTHSANPGGLLVLRVEGKQPTLLFFNTFLGLANVKTVCVKIFKFLATIWMCYIFWRTISYFREQWVTIKRSWVLTIIYDEFKHGLL